jgi:hypothetical protein
MGFIHISQNLCSNGTSSGIILEVENIRVLLVVSQSFFFFFFSPQFVWAAEC